MVGKGHTLISAIDGALTEAFDQALLPGAIWAIAKLDLFGHEEPSSPRSPNVERGTRRGIGGSKTALAIGLLSAAVALYATTGSIATIALGLCEALVLALAYILIERALVDARHSTANGGSVIYSANGLLSQPSKPAVSEEDAPLVVARDTSMAAAIASGCACLTLESMSFGGLAYWGLLGQAMGDNWVFGQWILTLLYGLVMVIVTMALYGTLLIMVSLQTRHQESSKSPIHVRPFGGMIRAGPLQPPHANSRPYRI